MTHRYCSELGHRLHEAHEDLATHYLTVRLLKCSNESNDFENGDVVICIITDTAISMFVTAMLIVTFPTPAPLNSSNYNKH